MRKVSILILCCITATISIAQSQKANYSLLQDFKKNTQNINTLYPSIEYINDTDKFWYKFKTSEGKNYYIVDPAKKSKKLLFDTKELIGKISTFTREAANAGKFSLSDLKFDKKGTVIRFSHDGEKYRYDYKSKVLKQIPKEKKKKKNIDRPSAYRLSNDSLYILYVKNYNLFIRGNEEKGMDTTQIQLTTDGTKYNCYARYYDEGTEFASPHGRFLKDDKTFLIHRTDKSKCDEMHIIDYYSSKRPKLKTYKYSIPGDEKIGRYTLHLLDMKTRKITDIVADKWKDQYVEYAYDSKDGERIYLYRTKRTWDEKELCIYNRKTKEIKAIINEKDKPFFDYVIAQTHFINDGKEIILRSERTNYGHFYLYNGLTGEFKRTITSGNYVTGQIHKIDTLKRNIYFYGFGREKNIDPYYYMLYKANLDKGGVTLLTPDDGNHKVRISKSNKYLVDSYSRVDMEHRTVVRDDKGKIVMKLDTADIRAVYDKGWRKPERFKVKSADGVTDLYGVMWKPMDFDPTKKYPVISEVYPGPQFEYVPTSFDFSSGLGSELAQLGFIVIQVGHRGGTPMRGKFYHRHSYKNLRDYALADDKAAIEELARRHEFIDIKKVGIFGHSGGGFMSTAAICTYPDFYTAAVSSAGNHDNNIYNTGWIEMNNGVEEIVKTVKDSVTGKEEEVVSFKVRKIHTNMELAKNYKGGLLLVHGLMDDNVNPAHSIRMAKSLMKAGKNFDMILLPESTHGFRSEEDTYFEGKMWRHFAKYLLNDVSGDFQYNIMEFDNKTK